MARIAVIPEQAVISSLRHCIDFYVYRGQPCARRWPQKPKGPRAAATQPMISAFRYAVYMYSKLSPLEVERYRHMARGTDLTPREYFMRAYMGGIRY